MVFSQFGGQNNQGTSPSNPNEISHQSNRAPTVRSIDRHCSLPSQAQPKILIKLLKQTFYILAVSNFNLFKILEVKLLYHYPVFPYHNARGAVWLIKYCWKGWKCLKLSSYMSIYELKCRVKYTEHKKLAALFNAEMREFSEISSECDILRFRFAHVSTYLQICKFAHVCKSVHVNPFTHVSKIYSICNNLTFDS